MRSERTHARSHARMNGTNMRYGNSFRIIRLKMMLAHNVIMEILCKTIWKLFTLPKIRCDIVIKYSSCNWNLSKCWKCLPFTVKWMHSVAFLYSCGILSQYKIQVIFERITQMYHEIIMYTTELECRFLFLLKVNKCRFYCHHWVCMRLIHSSNPFKCFVRGK